MHDTTRYDAMRYDTHILDFVYVLRVLFLFSNDWFFSGIFYFHHFRFSSRLVSALLLLELFFTVQFFFFRFSATRRKWFCTRQDSFLSSIRSSSACVYVCAENLSICHAMPFAQSILKKYAICYWNLHILLNMCVCESKSVRCTYSVPHGLIWISLLFGRPTLVATDPIGCQSMMVFACKRIEETSSSSSQSKGKNYFSPVHSDPLQPFRPSSMALYATDPGLHVDNQAFILYICYNQNQRNSNTINMSMFLLTQQ